MDDLEHWNEEPWKGTAEYKRRKDAGQNQKHITRAFVAIFIVICLFVFIYTI